jgi:hypothetical protein
VIDFVGRLADDPSIHDGHIFHKATDWIIVIGEKDVVPAVELGARFCRVGETVAVWSHSKYAYGLAQRRHPYTNTAVTSTTTTDGEYYVLPVEANVMYTLTVKELLESTTDTDADQQIRVARSKKNIGNDIYANEWFGDMGKQRAKQEYKRGADMMLSLLQSLTYAADAHGDADQDTTTMENAADLTIQQQAESVMLDCLNNIAALHIRAKEYKLAKEAAVLVLTHDPDNFKALLRAAKAALLDPGSSYEEVAAAIQAASERTDDNIDLQRLRAEFRRRKHAYKESSKAMFSKIGKSIGVSSSNQNSVGSPEKSSASEPHAATHPSECDEATVLVSKSNQKREEKSLLNWRSWDWKGIMFAYGFQVMFFISMYFIVTFVKKETELEQSLGTPIDRARFKL